MKLFEYKKYFFINISALWSLVTLYLIIVYNKTDCPPPAPNEFISCGFGEFMTMILGIIILLWLFAFTILEILIRKYLIEKKFPDFKLNLKIKIPKFVEIIYNIIFSIGFISACIIFVIAVIFLLIAIIVKGISFML